LQLGVLDQLFPELRALVGCRLNESMNHPSEAVEDAFTHTKRAVDAAVRLSADLDRPRRVAVMLATLCHVFGRSGAEQTLAVMQRLGLHTLSAYNVRAQVQALVGEQAKPREFYAHQTQTTDGDFRRLARHVENGLLYRVAKACALAHLTHSPTDDEAARAADYFIERVRALGVEQGPPAPLLLGRHLMEMGVAPGPQMGELLRQVYERQLDGEVRTLDDAQALARHLHAHP
jgi:tRNA nucleotidyltransferase (CCA-adding enzyme)